jgi:hypothetical protein
MGKADAHRTARVQSVIPSDAGLLDYGIALGTASAHLAPAVWHLHCVGSCTRAQGRFTVQRGGGPLGRLLGAVLRLPAVGAAMPVRLRIDRTAYGEVWRRELGGRALVTRQRVVARGTIEERLGRMLLILDVRAVDGALVIDDREIAFVVGGGRVRIPRWISPRVSAVAAAGSGDGVLVRVRVSFPGGGLLCAYAGWVREADAG